MPLSLAQLPDAAWFLAWLGVGCFVVAVMALFGFAKIMSFLRALRSDLASELKREIAEQKEAQPMAVQQPLIVKPHEGYTPLEKHEALVGRVDALESEVDKRIAGVSEAASAGREKIYNQLNAQREMMAANTQKTDLTYAQVQTLDGKIDRILARMPRTSS